MKFTKYLSVLCFLSILGAGCASSQPTSSTNSQPAASGKTYTLDEVAKHATASDCWMAVKGKVYDMTAYIPNHPAGDKILAGCGKDATDMMKQTKNGQGHSDYAYGLLNDYYKGDLKQ